MTAMLQALKHRGPDSTGYAVYGEPTEGDYIMRLKVAEAEDMDRGRGIHQVIADRIATVEEILAEHGAKIKSKDAPREYSLRYVLSHSGDGEHRKFEVQFKNFGKKTILERFLEPLD